MTDQEFGASSWATHPMDGETVVDLPGKPMMQCGQEILQFGACPKCGHGQGMRRGIIPGPDGAFVRCHCGVVIHVIRK